MFLSMYGRFFSTHKGDSIPVALGCYFPNLPRSSSMTLSSNFLNSGAG